MTTMLPIDMLRLHLHWLNLLEVCLFFICYWYEKSNKSLCCISDSQRGAYILYLYLLTLELVIDSLIMPHVILTLMNFCRRRHTFQTQGYQHPGSPTYPTAWWWSIQPNLERTMARKWNCCENTDSPGVHTKNFTGL